MSRKVSWRGVIAAFAGIFLGAVTDLKIHNPDVALLGDCYQSFMADYLVSLKASKHLKVDNFAGFGELLADYEQLCRDESMKSAQAEEANWLLSNENFLRGRLIAVDHWAKFLLARELGKKPSRRDLRLLAQSLAFIRKQQVLMEALTMQVEERRSKGEFKILNLQSALGVLSKRVEEFQSYVDLVFRRAEKEAARNKAKEFNVMGAEDFSLRSCVFNVYFAANGFDAEWGGSTLALRMCEQGRRPLIVSYIERTCPTEDMVEAMLDRLSVDGNLDLFHANLMEEYGDELRGVVEEARERYQKHKE